MSSRIVTLTSAPHPRARIDSVDAANGVCLFAWLDAEGRQVDSGGSIARFSPVPVPATEPQEFEEPSDATIANAIANPPAEILPVPESVTRRQLLLVLNSLGVTRAMIHAQIGNNEAALIEFDEAMDFRRDHPLVAQIGAALGFTAAQIDDAFRSAAAL